MKYDRYKLELLEDASTVHIKDDEADLNVYVRGMPSCCGMTLVHGLLIYDISYEAASALHDLHEFLTDYDYHNELGWENDRGTARILSSMLSRSKLVISDAIGGEETRLEEACLSYMAETNEGWTAIGEGVFNPNSDNFVRLWEYNRKDLELYEE